MAHAAQLHPTLGVRAAHAVQEARESVPVVKHQVTHAQERDLFQTPRPRVSPECAFCDAIKCVIIVPLQCILPCKGYAMLLCAVDDLLQQCLRAAAALRWVLAVAHLHARETQPRLQALQELHDGLVAVPVPRVIVASTQLRRMRAALEPPVHASQLDAQVAGRLELVHHVAICGLFDHAQRTRTAPLVEHSMCSSEDALGVAYEHTTVPGQEEVAVWRAPAASLASEEASFPTAAVIVASIMWPTQAPLRVACLLGCTFQVI
mmetsp:Transcript_17830/g.49797  ORF Transcript_17830/g.49797 Transcript_17830/m.49797 type:complete len:263 (-) Transcript_17830:868-1656(-)